MEQDPAALPPGGHRLAARRARERELPAARLRRRDLPGGPVRGRGHVRPLRGRRHRAPLRPRLRRPGRSPGLGVRGRCGPPPRPEPPRPEGPSAQAAAPPQVPLARALVRPAGRPHPGRDRRLLRLPPLHGAVPPGRLLGSRRRRCRRPGRLRRHADQPGPEAGRTRRGRHRPRLRPGGRAQLGPERPGARLLRDARAHEGLAGLRAAARPEEPGADHGHDPGGLAAEPDRGVARHEVRHRGQRVRPGAQGPRARCTCPLSRRATPRATCSPRRTRCCRTKRRSAC